MKLIVATLCLVAQALTGPAQDPPPPPDPATALVIGTVVDGSNGKPIAGVVVTMTGMAAFSVGATPATAPSAPDAVLTGSDGRFMFSRLKGGMYNLDGDKAGFLRGGVGSTRPGMSAGGIGLQIGEQRTDVIIRLWKAAAMGGLVLDDGGEPAIGVEVKFVRRQTVGTRILWSPAGISTTRTDDRGIYRVAGVTPGDYIAYIPVTQATLPSSVMDEYQKGQAANNDTYRSLMTEFIRGNLPLNGAGSAGSHQVGDFIVSPTDGMPSPTNVEGAPSLAYASVYHPASSTLSGATPFKLASGEERYDINFQLRPVRTIRISGTLMGPDGPVGLTRVSLSPANNAGMYTDIDAAATVTDMKGTFTFFNVPQGQHMLRVLRVPRVNSTSNAVTTVVQTGAGTSMMSMSSSGPSLTPPLPPDPVLWAEQSVAAGDENITGLVVTARTGIRVQGRVEFSGTATKPDETQMAGVSVRLSPVDGRSQLGAGTTRVSGTGELTSQGYSPGSFFVSASLPSSLQGWTLATVMHGGIDVSQSPLELTSGDVKDLVITFTDQKTSLSGVARDTSNTPDPTGMAVIFPADRPIVADEPLNPRRVRSARAMSTGKFAFGTLPPGDYFVAGVSADEERWNEPAFLLSLRAQATRVTLAPGQPATADVVVRKVR